MSDQKPDQGVLTHLLVDFISDIGLNFSAFDNLKFHAFVKYLNPEVKLPTSAEMTKFYKAFTERNNKVLVNVENDGDRNSEQYMPVDVPYNQVKYRSHEYLDTEQQSLQNSMETGSNKISMQIQNMEYTNQNYGLNYGAAFENGSFPSEQLQTPDEPVTIDTENHQEEKCSLIDWENSPNDSTNDNSPIGQESFQDSNSYASSSLAPALHCRSFGNIDIKQEDQANLPYPKYFLGCKVLKINKNIVTLKSISGYLNNPCIVCCERKKGRDMQEVKGYNAYIMIFACIRNGYYSKEKGKDICRLNKFYSCRYHLDEMYNSACKHMDIVNPTTDIHARNKNIVDALPFIKEIKSSRETIERNNNLGSFIALVKKFCDTYKRD